MNRDWKRYVTFKRVLVYFLVVMLVVLIAGCTLYGLGTEEQGGIFDGDSPPALSR